MEPENRLLLRAWIEAILHHAVEHIAEPGRRTFIDTEIAKLEEDFRVKIWVSEDLQVQVDDGKNLLS